VRKVIDFNKISKKRILVGMNYFIRNAVSLLKEAKLLEQNKAYNRSFVLCTLSIEEAMKVVFICMFFHSDLFPQGAINNFLKKFTNHKMKIYFFENWHGRLWKSLLYARKRKHLSESKKEVKKYYKSYNKAVNDVYGFLSSMNLSSIIELKLKCLYVDIDEKGNNFCYPIKIPAKVAKSLIFLAQEEIDSVKILRNTFRRSNAEELSEGLTALAFKDEIMKYFLEVFKTEEEAMKE
jgi:AbiV family abortive infection protein